MLSQASPAVDRSKGKRRHALLCLLMGSNKEGETFRPPSYLSGFTDMISGGDATVATSDFCCQFARDLSKIKGTTDLVAATSAVPCLNRSQWSAFLSGQIDHPISDDGLLNTASFAYQHLMPANDLNGVPKRGASLIATSKADMIRDQQEGRGEHATKLTSRSGTIHGTTDIVSGGQIAQNAANVVMLLRVGVAHGGKMDQNGTLGAYFYKVATAAASPDLDSEAQAHSTTHPYILHALQQGVAR